MLIKMPDDSWLDPRAVKAIYHNTDEKVVYAHVGPSEEIPFFPPHCKKFENSPEPTLQELSDTIVTLINNELGRRV